MSFSLRNLVKHVADDVNPFDGPQQAPRAAPPPPASTARPQQTLSVQPAHNATFSTTPFQRAPLPQFKTTVAAPQNLSIGNQVIAPSQTARSGQAPAPIQPTNLDKAKAIDFAGASSAVKGLGEVAHSPDLLRFATPNFIPGVSKYVDPAIKKTADALQSPFNLAHKGIDTQAEQLGLHDNPATPFVPDTSGLEGANRLGNVVGTAASFGATGGIGATRDAVTAARALPSTIKAVPEIAPKVADATRQVVAHTTGLVSPKFAGLNKDQVIMDPAKLDVLKNALNPGSQSDVNLRQEIINGLHQIKNDHGHDFISGSPADRKQRISQFLEQNGEAIPELQKWMDRPGLAKSEAGGAKAGDILPDRAFGADQPATPIGDVLANKQAQLASNAPRVTTKLVPPQPTEIPVPGDIPTTNAGKVKRTRFTSKTVQNSDEVSPEAKAQTEASYTSDTMKGATARAEAHIVEHGADKSLEQTLSELNVARGNASRDTLARAIEHAKAQDALGTEQGSAMASKLYELAGEHGSAKGQGAQILSLIAKRSPAGLRNKAFRDLKEGGVDTSLPENKHIRDEIQGHIDTIKSMEDGPAKDLQIAVLQKAVAKHLPQSKGDQLLSLWKAGLLSGVRTHGGNILSNTAFGALKKVSDVPATGADIALKYAGKVPGAGKLGFKGERTKSLTGRGIANGTGEGLRNAKGTLKTGIDVRNVGDKYEQHAELNLGNPILQKTLGNAANGVFRLLSSADQPTYYATFKNSLYDQAKADGINQGLSGKGLRQHMDELVKNPTEDMAATAEKEANKSVLSYDTFGSKAVSGMHRGIDLLPGSTNAGKAIAHAALNVLAPFVRVPSAFISRTVDFTPLGVPKEVFHQVAGKKFDQRALSQAIGEGATGTGIIALGIALTQNKLLSGDYPKNNPKEAARWKAEGITPNSVKVGNKWISLNYMGPVGLLFNAGNKLETAKGESALNRVGAAVAGLGQGLLGQSFLQGFSGFSDAINDPARNAKSFLNSEASSLIPSLSNDAAVATDKYQRNANSPLQAAKNRIPGARESNSIKTDVYGNDLKRPSSPLDTFNPLRPSNSLSNPVISEVNRLHTVDPNNSDLQVTPTPVDRSISVEGKTVNLNDKQRQDLQKQIGQETQNNWDRLIKTPTYQTLSDTDKANALNTLRTATTTDAQRAYVTSNSLATYNKPATASVIKANQGNVEGFAKAKSTGSSSGSQITVNPKIDQHSQKVLNEYNTLDANTKKQKAYKEPSYDYKVEKAKYDNDLANGKLSTAQKIKKQDSLAKAEVGSSFTKDTRELYELNKDDIAKYVENDPDGKAIAAKVIAYDQALTAKGVQAKNKFKNGLISYTASSAKGRAAAGRRKATSDYLASLKSSNSAASQNQKALLNLVKGAKVTGAKRKLNVSSVALKKQKAKKQKVRVA